MSEKDHRKSEHLFLQKGDRVKIRNLSAQVFITPAPYFFPNTTYRVFHIERHADQGGDTAWLGPGTASDATIEAFTPSKFSPAELKRVYPDVLPLSVKFLKKAK